MAIEQQIQIWQRATAKGPKTSSQAVAKSVLCLTKYIDQFCYSSIELIAVYNEKLKITQSKNKV